MQGDLQKLPEAISRKPLFERKIPCPIWLSWSLQPPGPILSENKIWGCQIIFFYQSIAECPNGKITILAWPQVTDFENPRYASCGCLWCHQVLKVWTHSVDSCDYGTSLNFLGVGSRDPTWWPDITWPGVEIFRRVTQKMRDQLGKIRRCCAPPFFLHSKKTWGGVETPPPLARPGLRRLTDPYRSSFFSLKSGTAELKRISYHMSPEPVHFSKILFLTTLMY